MLTWFPWLRAPQTPLRSIQYLCRQKFVFGGIHFPLPCSRVSFLLFNLSPTTWIFSLLFCLELGMINYWPQFFNIFFKSSCPFFPLAKLFPSFSLFAFGRYQFFGFLLFSEASHLIENAVIGCCFFFLFFPTSILSLQGEQNHETSEVKQALKMLIIVRKKE